MKRLIAYIAFLSIYLIFNSQILLKHPPVWTDEAFYLDTISNFIKNNNLGTGLLGTIPNYGFDKNTLYYPPAFFIFYKIWFSFLPIDIYNLRLFPLLVSTAVIIFIYIISNNIFGKINYVFRILPVLFLVIDDNFLYASHFARPEIFILLFGLIEFYLISIKLNHDNNLYIKLIMGLMAAIAFLTHFVGLYIFISILLYLLIKKESVKGILVYIAAFSLPVLIWVLLVIFPNISLFLKQMELVGSRKNFDMWRWDWLTHISSIDVPIINVCYVIISVASIKLFLKKSYAKLLILLIISAWIFAIYGKNIPYFVLPLPFLYLLIPFIYSYLRNDRFVFLLLSASYLLIAILNIRILVGKYMLFRGNNYDYGNFTKKIFDIIPDKKTVFLSVIPDPFPAFFQSRNNKIIEYPPFETKKEFYLNALNQSDYIIINGLYEPPVYNNLLVDYIHANTQKAFSIDEEDQYKAIIIELKSISDRKY